MELVITSSCADKESISSIKAHAIKIHMFLDSHIE